MTSLAPMPGSFSSARSRTAGWRRRSARCGGCSLEIRRRRSAALSKAIEQFGATGEFYRIPGLLLARRPSPTCGLGGSGCGRRSPPRRRGAANSKSQTDIRSSSRPRRSTRLDRVHDERVALALQHGRPDAAFEVAEGGRARALRATRRARDEAASKLAEPLRLADLRARLEPGTTMLFFSVLPDRILRWHIEQHRSSLIDPHGFAEGSRAHGVFIRGRAAGRRLDGHATRAGDAPVRCFDQPCAPRTGPLVLIPDGELHRLPFAALIDPATRRFLIEDRVVAVAPSASWYVEGKDRSRTPVAAPRDALVVGDPHVSADLFPGMASLPGARSEARTVAALYPERELLLGGAATRAAFVGSLNRHQVVHFAGHAITNRTNPERSSLPLADDRSAEGSVLFGTEIAGLDLSRTQAVVLSGCETAGGALADGEGPLSVARAFLAAGVPSVVASLWPIQDGPSVPLVTAFHRGLRQGEPPAAALRSAQLAALHSAQRDRQLPSVWASFQAFGG